MAISYEVEVPEELAVTLETLARRCTAIDKRRDGATSHGPLTVEGLLTMLAEDCGDVVTRPRSSEGENMAQVLTSHGYEITD
jgi:hypothetical protein